MKADRYPAYKDSGVPWLGEIPSHWEVWKVAHAFKHIGSGTTPPTSEYDWYEGDIPWVTTGELRESVIYDTEKHVSIEAVSRFSALKIHPKGALVIAMYGATTGRLGILGTEAATNQACCVLDKAGIFHSKYFYYWLWAFRQEIIALSSGGGQPNISQDKISSIKSTVPLIPEQTAIAAFLDRETARLDALLGKKQRLIDLLCEERAALISRAVTQGLDPAAPLKESGIDWLGRIPAHWEVKPFRYCCRISEGQIDPKHEDFAETVLIAPNHIESDTGRIICLETASEQGAISGKYRVRTGDLVYSKIRPALNKLCIAEGDWLCSADMYPISHTRRMETKFLFYFMLSRPFVQLTINESMRVAMPKINRETLSACPVMVPPLTEQQTIAAHLDRETARIDTLRAKVETAIERLKEYRAALIAAAVTGKIDVRAALPGGITP